MSKKSTKKTVKLYGKDLICTQEWSIDELLTTLKLAEDMKKNRYAPKYTGLLKNKTFFMFFFNPSVRTRQSFECAATELGGHAQFLTPEGMRLKGEKTAGETVEDAAKVMSRYACGIGIRILEDKVKYYGQGNELLREYAHYSDIPIINMADDKFHPCQGLADIMALRNHLGEGRDKSLKGKKLLLYWGHGALARSWCSVQEAALLYSRFGMSVTIASPEGYNLDPEVIKQTKNNCEQNGQKCEILHDPVEGYKSAHVVYSRNWMSPQAYEGGTFHKQEEIEKALKYTDWICDEEKMKFTDNGLFIHPMPIDRGHEVTDEVASSTRSIIIEVAENRLHVQKAIMGLTMSEKYK